MRNLIRRLDRLERPAGGCQDQVLVIVSGGLLALDDDRCVEILREAGFIREGPGIRVVDLLLSVPPGLDAQELERFLREHGDVL